MKSHPLHFCTGLTLPAPHFLSLNKWSLGLVVLALSFLPAPPTFGQIFSINIYGPGGTGTTPGSQGGDFLDFSLTYTSVDSIDVGVGITTPGTLFVNVGSSNLVTNNTGQIWTGFTFELQPGYTGAIFKAGDWVDESGEFPTVVTEGYSVSFSGGSIAPNSSFDPLGQIGGTDPSGFESFAIVGTPSVAPEPSAGGLLLFGLLGAIGGRRLRRQGERR